MFFLKSCFWHYKLPLLSPFAPFFSVQILAWFHKFSVTPYHTLLPYCYFGLLFKNLEFFCKTSALHHPVFRSQFTENMTAGLYPSVLHTAEGNSHNSCPFSEISLTGLLKTGKIYQTNTCVVYSMHMRIFKIFYSSTNARVDRIQ